MSAPAHIYHRGVLRVAGAVHVGPPALQVKHYLSDAEGYARTAESTVERLQEEMRQGVIRADECAQRSLICATVQALIALGIGDDANRQNRSDSGASDEPQAADEAREFHAATSENRGETDEGGAA